ncbi:hypothetical protein ACFLSQ_06345 [Bacteroidota bacterium]
MNGNIDKNVKFEIIESLCNQCIDLLIKAFRLSLRKGMINKEWEEDSFTAHLYKFIEILQIDKKWIVNPQVPIYNKDITSGKISALKAPKPDLKFQKYDLTSGNLFVFYIEMKNLSENNWSKTSGSNVSSSYYIGRYVYTGIDNFISERYRFGCLAGYVVEGRVDKIVAKVNIKLEKLNRKNESLSITNVINGFNDSYISNHISKSKRHLKLKHIFLKF